MTILSDQDIRKLIDDKIIRFSPAIPSENIQPASIDLRLGEQIFRSGDKRITNLKIGESIELKPGELAVTVTLEELELPQHLAGKIGLKSKFTRQGLLLLSGPQVDPGYRGRLFLTLINLSGESIFITCGEEFITLELFKLSSKSTGYEGDFQNKVNLDYRDIEPIRKGGYLYKIDEIRKSMELSDTIQKFFIPILLFVLSVLMVIIPILIFLLQDYCSRSIISGLYVLNIKNLEYIILAEIAFLLSVLIIKQIFNIYRYIKFRKL